MRLKTAYSAAPMAEYTIVRVVIDQVPSVWSIVVAVMR